MPSSNSQARFEQLKKQVLELGFVRPGSLVRRYMPCGNPSCHCMGTPPRLHGPYYQWSYKIAGKTRSIRLSEQQAKLCEQWVRNHKRLKRLLQQMERLSLEETDRILGAISRS
jgi:Family of unknown function (DUF6788)